MRHLKTYENDNFDLSVGDYVIIKTNNYDFSKRYNDFLESHIGIVNRIEDNFFFYVNFIIDEQDTIPKYNVNHVFSMRDLKYHSKSLEDLKITQQTSKYNL